MRSLTVGQRQLRVLYSFPHTLGAPGIGTTAFHQIVGLVEAGVDVTVYCTWLGRALPESVTVVETLRLRDRRVPHRALGVERAYEYHDWRVARHLRSESRYDIVHTWPAGCLRSLAECRRRSIVGVREAPSEHTAGAFERAASATDSVGVPLPKNHAHAWNDRRLAKELAEFAAADALLVPSEYVRRSFVARGFPDDRLLLHHYGHDPATFFPPASLGGDGPLRAAFAGRGEPNKGLHLALEAWRASEVGSSGARFEIVGAILPAYRERIDDLLRDDSVHLKGFVSDVGAVFREVDALILPSLTEGSALVTYEAQACGCICLVSDATGAWIEDGEDGFVHAAGDAGRLEEHLRLVANDVDRRTRMKEAAARNARRFTWRRAGERLREAYIEGISRSAGSR